MAFTKKFRPEDLGYHYCALAIPSSHTYHGGTVVVNRNGSVEVPVSSPQYWYLTQSNTGSLRPKTWPELVAFMGVQGLTTLEVLR